MCTPLEQAVIKEMHSMNKIYALAIISSVEKILNGKGDTSAIVLGIPPFDLETEYFKEMINITVEWEEEDNNRIIKVIRSLSYDNNTKLLFITYNPLVLSIIKRIIIRNKCNELGC